MISLIFDPLVPDEPGSSSNLPPPPSHHVSLTRTRCLDQPYDAGIIERVNNRTSLSIKLVDHNDKTIKVNTAVPGVGKKVLGRRAPPVARDARRVLPRSKAIHHHDHLDSLRPLNRPEVLRYLEREFRMDKIYSKNGNTLVAINPFKWINIYNDKQVLKYHEGDISYDTLPPHPYAVSCLPSPVRGSIPIPCFLAFHA